MTVGTVAISEPATITVQSIIYCPCKLDRPVVIGLSTLKI